MAEQTLEQAHRARQDALRRRDDAKTALDGVSEPEEPSDASESKYEALVAEIDEKLKKSDAAVGARNELESITRQIESAGTQIRVYKAIEWAAKRLRGENVSEAQGPFLDTVQGFVAAAWGDGDVFIEAEERACRVGWRRPDGKSVVVQAMSGAEWAVFATALTSAIILAIVRKQRDPGIQILAVEADAANPESAQRLVNGIETVADKMDGTLIATWNEDPYHDQDGWEVVDARDIRVEEEVTADG